MKRDPRTPVQFGFMKYAYYRLARDIDKKVIEVKGVKSLKLFKSWFRLQKNKGRLLYGYIKFADGEKWIWQPESTIRRDKYWHGGWQRVSASRHEREIISSRPKTVNR